MSRTANIMNTTVVARVIIVNKCPSVVLVTRRVEPYDAVRCMSQHMMQLKHTGYVFLHQIKPPILQTDRRTGSTS